MTESDHRIIPTQGLSKKKKGSARALRENLLRRKMQGKAIADARGQAEKEIEE